ncbi:UNVERIFIED_ORG: hypothetical protein ABRZ91_001045 [Heyndrickxia coagulans]
MNDYSFLTGTAFAPLVANATGEFLKAGRTMGLAGKHALSKAEASHDRGRAVLSRIIKTYKRGN